jgi:formate C-acetyltransferase
MALNLKWSRVGITHDALLERFQNYVTVYFNGTDNNQLGGMEVQFNVTSRDTFIDATQHPEKYPELLVRVSGYTAYFKDLTPQMQREIIERTEYDLSSGNQHDYEPYVLPGTTPAAEGADT